MTRREDQTNITDPVVYQQNLELEARGSGGAVTVRSKQHGEQRMNRRFPFPMAIISAIALLALPSLYVTAGIQSPSDSKS